MLSIEVLEWQRYRLIPRPEVFHCTLCGYPCTLTSASTQDECSEPWVYVGYRPSSHEGSEHWYGIRLSLLIKELMSHRSLMIVIIALFVGQHIVGEVGMLFQFISRLWALITRVLWVWQLTILLTRVSDMYWRRDRTVQIVVHVRVRLDRTYSISYLVTHLTGGLHVLLVPLQSCRLYTARGSHPVCAPLATNSLWPVLGTARASSTSAVLQTIHC